ncbi:MAG TPA: ABC-F family ATP-binding cassette domain-containing protein [Soehngenia sp.]|nr:ABC-F family ATP-binding cassette domain-containing protein [Soehngenia sp.]HPP31289.1 ABC-F family ATP-binding cassette domain-containing protein [Soehngenia sp.]
MLVLSASNITKSYVDKKILENISFFVEEKDKIGLLGLNGAGKTTLFEIISGNVEPDSGEIFIKSTMKIGYLKQHTKVDSDLTMYEECLTVFEDLIKMEERIHSLAELISEKSNAGDDSYESNLKEYGTLLEEFNSRNGYGFKSEIKGVLKGLGFTDEDFDKSVNILSGGQKSRLALAKMLLEKPDILLLDEPTNHLDIESIEWLENFIKDYDKALLLISHDRYFLDKVVNRVFYLENRNIYIYNTNYTKFMEQRKRDLEILKKQYEDQQKEIKRQTEIIERYMQYGDERYIKQARSRQKMLEKMKVIDKIETNKKLSLSFEPSVVSGRDVLLAEKITKSFDGETLFKDISLSIYRGEKVGLIGPNGIGKTTLFKILLGKMPFDGGEISLGKNVVTGYFDQEMAQLSDEKTVIDEIWDAYPYLNHYQVRSYLSRFLFIGDDLFKEVSTLSGGEKARLSLLKLMLSNANFLLMDEPTNHLDIDSKEVLEDALNMYSGTVFVISHDRYFLNQIATKIYELTQDGIFEYLGNYDYYLEKKKELNEEEPVEEEKTKTQIKLEKKKEKELIQREREQRERQKSLEKTILELEQKLNEIDLILADPKTYEDHEKALEISKKRDDVEEKLNELYDKWMDLS